MIQFDCWQPLADNLTQLTSMTWLHKCDSEIRLYLGDALLCCWIHELFLGISMYTTIIPEIPSTTDNQDRQEELAHIKPALKWVTSPINQQMSDEKSHKDHHFIDGLLLLMFYANRLPPPLPPPRNNLEKQRKLHTRKCSRNDSSQWGQNTINEWAAQNILIWFFQKNRKCETLSSVPKESILWKYHSR